MNNDNIIETVDARNWREKLRDWWEENNATVVFGTVAVLGGIAGAALGYFVGEKVGIGEGYGIGTRSTASAIEPWLDRFAQAGSDAAFGALYEDCGEEFKSLVDKNYTQESLSKAVKDKYDSNVDAAILKDMVRSMGNS